MLNILDIAEEYVTIEMSRTLNIIAEVDVMKIMDEMSKNIRLRSESLGYKAAVLCLAIWTMYDSWHALSHGGQNGHNILPMMFMTIAICVQSFSEMVMKRKMISGDDEYKEPNKTLRSIIAIIALSALVISVGSYLVLTINFGK